MEHKAMRLSLLTLSLLLLVPISACGDEIPIAEDASSHGKVMAMECGDFSFVAEIKGDDAWLFLPDYSGPIPRVTSASGTKYQGNNITFWSKGDEASLDYGKNSYAGCRNNPALAVWEAAKLRGVDFRATGNEPGWVLEITGDSLSLQTNYGESHHQFAAAERKTDTATRQTSYLASNGDSHIEVTLEGKSCQDTMADTVFETSVSIQLDERKLSGCGKALH
jgi:uncharacterized membrane protein